MPLTATGMATPLPQRPPSRPLYDRTSIDIYNAAPPEPCYEPSTKALNLIAEPSGSSRSSPFAGKRFRKMPELAHGHPQHPNYTLCIYTSCISGDFRPSHLTKPEKSATTQSRDWWLVFPASIFSRIAGQGNAQGREGYLYLSPLAGQGTASRARGVSVFLSLARVSVADVATEVCRPSVGYRSRPRAAQGMCSANLS